MLADRDDAAAAAGLMARIRMALPDLRVSQSIIAFAFVR